MGRGRQYGHATRRTGCQQNCLKQRPALGMGRVAGSNAAVQRVVIHPCAIRKSRPRQQRRSSCFRQSHTEALPCCCGGMDVHVLPYERREKGRRQPVLAVLRASGRTAFGKIKVRCQRAILPGEWRAGHIGTRWAATNTPRADGSMRHQIGITSDWAGEVRI